MGLRERCKKMSLLHQSYRSNLENWNRFGELQGASLATSEAHAFWKTKHIVVLWAVVAKLFF